MVSIKRLFRRLLLLCLVCGIAAVCRYAYMQYRTPNVVPRHTLWETRYIGVVRNQSSSDRGDAGHTAKQQGSGPGNQVPPMMKNITKNLKSNLKSY